MKKMFFLAVFSALLISGCQITYGLSIVPSMGDTPEFFEITLSGTPISFSNQPIEVEGEILVPGLTFFENVGAQVYWTESTQTLVAYRDNVFLKYTGNRAQYHLNGLEKDLPIRAMMRGETLFVPLASAAEAFNLNYTINADQHTAAIDYRETAYQYRQIGYNHYKRINLASWGISYYVPEFWHLIDNTYATYGFSTDYECYQFEPKVLPLESGFDRDTLMEALKSNLILEYGSQLDFGNSKTLFGGEYAGQALYYTVTDDTEIPTHYVLYIFYENDIGYIFTGRYSDINNLADTEEIFDTIARTFQINKLSINEQLEHYIELNRFFSASIHLDVPIYSNMRVENQFRLTGTIDPAITGMHVLVSKNTEQMEFYVPVIDGAFDTAIYTPFGLGKHNITLAIDDAVQTPEPLEAPDATASVSRADVYTNEAGTDITDRVENIEALINIDEIVDSILNHTLQLNTTNTALKFSVINVSSETIKNLLPTEFVNYDHPDVYAASGAVTYNLTSNYAKARALYQWIYDHYNYSVLWSQTTIRTTEALIGTTDANAVELCVLYTGLLRANDIPARIVRGVTPDDYSSYWVETYINGKWLIADLPSDLISKDESGIHYFNVSATLQYQDFQSIEYLPF